MSYAPSSPASENGAPSSAPATDTALATGTASTAGDLYQPPSDAELAIDVRHVSRRFGRVDALEDVSLQVPVGSIVGVIGPSGSGKTTTIRLITGVLRPTSGDLRVLGQQPRRFSRQTREQIGYMPQQLVLYPELTARENIDFVGALFGMLPWRRHRRTEQVLRLVELWGVRDRLVAHMSGGMQSRVALACALVHDPALLILDEPTAGIDPLLRQQVWAELRRLRDEGVTVLVTTQYVSEAEYCDWVALISEGQLVAYASPDEVRRQALGGDVIQIVTAADFEASRLARIEDVVAVRQVGPRELLAISTDAGQALPRVVDAIDEAGGDVEWSREYRPSFDEVFAELVTRHAERGRAAGGAPPAGAGSLRLPRGLRR